jgi:hypothetical protein
MLKRRAGRIYRYIKKIKIMKRRDPRNFFGRKY